MKKQSKSITLRGAPGETPQHEPRTPGVRLLTKREVLVITSVSYVSLWTWMREGKFPRARTVGGRSMWVSTEIEAWLNELPVRKLKGDDSAAISP